MKTYAYNRHYEKEGIAWTSLLACVGGTLLLLFAIMLFGFNQVSFSQIIEPALMPSITLFKVLFLISFALYGYSLHRLIVTPSLNRIIVRYKKVSASMWIIGIILAATWLLLFFTFELYLLSFIWATVLSSILVTMIIVNFRIDKLSFFSLIPCTLLSLFTIYLTLSIAIIN